MVAEPPQRSPRKGGRSQGPKRSAEATEAILAATLDLLVEAGYNGMAIEAVAARAGVGKATVYRWWPTKAALVGDAIASHLDLSAVPDMGDTRAELIEAVDGAVRNFGSRWAGTAIAALAADISRDPEALAAFRQWFLVPRRRVPTEVVNRGIERGDLPPNVDRELIFDIFAGTIFYRLLISGGDVTSDLSPQLADLVLHGKTPEVTPPDN